jgi:hypothetical protein
MRSSQEPLSEVAARQERMEKTLLSLDKFIKQISQDLGKSDSQKQQEQQFVQSTKQIQSQISDLRKQVTNVERSISNVVTAVVDRKKGKKNKKSKKGKKKK